MGDIKEIFTVKPYLNPIIKTVVDDLGIKIDLEKDPKDVNHGNNLEMVHSIDQDDTLEKAFYEKYSYMDGILPGSTKDGRITQTELMFYLYVVARFNKNSPLYELYHNKIRADIERVKKENNIVSPIDDPDGLVRSTLVNNISRIALDECQQQTGQTLEEFLITAYPDQQDFIRQAVAVLQKMSAALYDEKKPIKAFEDIKEKLFELIKNSFGNKVKGYFIHKLINSKNYLNVIIQEVNNIDLSYIPEQTATDILKLNQYPGDILRKGACRAFTFLNLAFDDLFDVAAGPVAMGEYGSSRDYLAHIAVKLYNNPADVNLDQAIVDMNEFDYRGDFRFQYADVMYYISPYNLTGIYALDKAHGLHEAGLNSRQGLQAAFGQALDYGEIEKEMLFDNLAWGFYYAGNPQSNTYDFKLTLKDFLLGAIYTTPKMWDLYAKMIILGFMTKEEAENLYLSLNSRKK